MAKKGDYRSKGGIEVGREGGGLRRYMRRGKKGEYRRKGGRGEGLQWRYMRREEKSEY